MSRVVVVGAGIVGAAVACELAERDHDVALLDRAEPGTAVSGASLACLGTHMIDADELPALRWSCEAWQRFAHDDPAAIEYRRCGQIRFLDDERQRAIAQRWIERERANGLRPEFLEPADVRTIEPALEGPIVGATWSPDDAVVNPFLAVRAFIRRARAHGATVRGNARVTAVSHDAGRVDGVIVDGEHIAADIVVLAAGPWTAALAASADVELPIVPRKAQCLATEALAPLIRTVVGACRDDGGVHSGYTQIQQSASGAVLFNNVLGGGISAPGDLNAPPEIDLPFLRDSVATLLRLFPSLANAALLRSWVRYEAVTPDDRFAIGPIGPAGLFVAAGDNGTGFVRAPAIARIIADALDAAAPPFPIDVYDPARFARLSAA